MLTYALGYNTGIDNIGYGAILSMVRVSRTNINFASAEPGPAVEHLKYTRPKGGDPLEPPLTTALAVL